MTGILKQRAEVNGWGRVVLALLVSPLVGAFTFLLLFLMTVRLWDGELWLRVPEFGLAAGWFLLIPYAVGLAAELVVGLPLLKVMLARSRPSIGSFVLGGIGVGLMVVLVVYWTDLPGIWTVALCVVPAVVASVFFGAVGGWIGGDAR